MLTATVTIGVFGLFHPHLLEIEPWGAARLQVSCAHGTLEGSARLQLTSDCAIAGLNNTPMDFVLAVPGRIRRHYRGTLKITRQSTGELLAAVTMALETAVASTVAAESPVDAAAAMLQAQAIVTRSYFAAGGHGRHALFDFCDTTHCQFIKDPPLADSGAARAARDTAGRVLRYRGQVISAFYAAKCDGLLAPLPASRKGPEDYPYFAVKCEYCSHHPANAPVKPNARPHHHGMCQLGADDLAKRGWSAAQILAHYYPGAELR